MVVNVSFLNEAIGCLFKPEVSAKLALSLNPEA